ncbi:MAG TPA: ABC transporter [Verrucomicrobiales bacterium]|jgi:oligopeptide transport system permease protein|nr:ABC transporter permease [Akkermansiaceae bacterium]HCC20846.1 ABC transporter [Verrucomicrobiales bacterium]HCI91109.1 ABC transporter [Verrucomicrobiales bacterium]HCL96551.1 ABC transporter [Verrucomicrobiales bacterium]
MLRIIISRLTQGILVIFCLLAITFVLIRLMPGDPFTGEKSHAAHIIEKNRENFSLDKPIPIQFGVYLTKLTQGDMGDSPTREQKVSTIIKHSFPASLILGICSMIVAICIGIPAGVIAALKKNSLIDYGTMVIAMIGISIPSFVIGPLLASYVAMNVPLLKVAGWGDPFDWILPSITLGAMTGAYIARITRGGMLEVINQDYIRTAKAKGVSQFNLIFKHAIRGGIIPAVAYVGPAFAMLLTGSFVVETIFQIPGMGQHFVTATKDRDYFLLQGVVLLFGTLIVLANLAADIALVLLNPRLREA